MGDAETGRLSAGTRDFLAGTVGGVVQVLIGQPFDIVKVKLQTAGTSVGSSGGSVTARGVVADVWSRGGVRGFYAGTLVPLLGVGACVSIQFSTLEWAKRQLRGDSEGNPLPQNTFALCYHMR